MPAAPPRRPVAARHALAAVAALLVAEGALRAHYRARDAAVVTAARARLARGAPPSAVARWAVAERNRAKDDVRDWDADVVRLLAEARNREVYGDPLGPSYAQLRAGRRPLSDAEIIASAGRTNAGVDRAARGLLAAGAALLATAVALAARAASRARAALGWECAALAAAVAGGWVGAKALGRAGALAGSLAGHGGALAGAAAGGVLGLVAGALVVGALARRATSARDR